MHRDDPDTVHLETGKAQCKMETNPYQSPKAAWALRPPLYSVVDRIGFMLSLLGVVGLCATGWTAPNVSTVAAHISFLCLPGFIVSLVGLLRPPRRLAAWGIGLGMFGTLYLPTIYLSLFVLGRD